MLVDFDKVFHPEEPWKNMNITDHSPCGKCPERQNFENNPYYQSSACDHCKEYTLWMVDVIRKLYWLEHGGTT